MKTATYYTEKLDKIANEIRELVAAGELSSEEGFELEHALDEVSDEIEKEASQKKIGKKDSAYYRMHGIEEPWADLHKIADTIRHDWKKVDRAAKPYLHAMQNIDADGEYGHDHWTTIVYEFLTAASSWRGPVAKEVKDKLNSLVIRETGFGHQWNSLSKEKAASADEDDFENDRHFTNHYHEDDAILTPSGRLGGKVSLSIEGKHIGEYHDEDQAEKALVQWITKHKYTPSVWWVDDHGGVSLYSISKENSKKIERVMSASSLKKAGLESHIKEYVEKNAPHLSSKFYFESGSLYVENKYSDELKKALNQSNNFSKVKVKSLNFPRGYSELVFMSGKKAGQNNNMVNATDFKVGDVVKSVSQDLAANNVGVVTHILPKSNKVNVQWTWGNKSEAPETLLTVPKDWYPPVVKKDTSYSSWETDKSEQMFGKLPSSRRASVADRIVKKVAKYKFKENFDLYRDFYQKIVKHGYIKDIIRVAEETSFGLSIGITVKLKPEVADDLSKTYKLFTSEKPIQDHIKSAGEAVQRYIKNILEKNKISPRDVRIDLDWQDEESLRIIIENTKTKEDVTFEPEALYLRGGSDQFGEDASESWNWAFWLMDEDSPFYDEDFKSAYQRTEAAQALEQFAHTLDESSFEDDFLEQLQKLDIIE
jgi:polyhydroxyalkanoate synthesis regulator phasin